ncbi:MAG TPA: nuclear transport factor 2 family protein [Streptosporangiaceae bacterium]|nr:nuclear transport factor 2 family protein [Streptosporangiaceae bacterium]
MSEDAAQVSGELRQFGEKWAEAEREGDVSALDELLSDDFIGVGPLGFLLTKEQWLGRYKSGDLANSQFGWEPTAIRSYGSAAVVIGVQTQQTSYKGQPVDGGRFRGTQVLLSDAGRWQMVSMQLSNLTGPVA